MGMDTIKVLIADDHNMVAKLINHMLKPSDEIEVVALVNDGNEVLEKAEEIDIDVMLLDIDMPSLDGIQTMIRVLKKHPETKAIILSHHSEPWVIQKSMESGASGYLTKYAESHEVIDAIMTVHQGGKYFCKTTLQKLAQNITKQDDEDCHRKLYEKLTKREKEVLKLIAEEYTNNEISETLHISPRTVEIHRKNIMDKLGAKNTVGLIKIIMSSKLIDELGEEEEQE